MRLTNRPVCIASLVIGAFVIPAPHRTARAGNSDPSAKAFASWGSDFPAPITAKGSAMGNFTVGRDIASVGGAGTVFAPTPPAPITFPYAANSGAGNVGFTATLSGGGTTATATSIINVGAVSNGFYPYTITLMASVSRGSFTPVGSARAPGDDPQFFNPSAFGPNPTFIEDVSLKSGASVVEDGPGTFAETSWSNSSDLLSSPIFSIDVTGSTTGPVTADVYFNPDPSLTFSTTAAALAAEIEASSIGTSGGTLSDISFSYSWNLSNFSVTSSDYVAASGVSIAVAVPEPSAIVMAALSAMIVGSWSRLRGNGAVRCRS